jgi:hypothetical protein
MLLSMTTTNLPEETGEAIPGPALFSNQSQLRNDWFFFSGVRSPEAPECIANNGPLDIGSEPPK